MLRQARTDGKTYLKEDNCRDRVRKDFASQGHVRCARDDVGVDEEARCGGSAPADVRINPGQGERATRFPAQAIVFLPVRDPGLPFRDGGILVQDLAHVSRQGVVDIMTGCRPVPGH
ncbi:MAG: hypothetical protein OXF88_07350 [Rhodobacteraceae bacterium]|nr:hypothetical protein [Paracoccaceae bacterium]MCY4140951.1 hypothetical protein [Paracoccaceae bacterium]